MENITHTLTGIALSRAGLLRQTPLAAPALVVAANLPDIEVFGSPFGFDYLESHRGITHSLAGAPVLAAGLAGCLYLIDRRRKRDRSARSSFLTLWIVSLAGILSHVALDFLNEYGIRPWMPFNSSWHYGDLLSIIDIWLWVILGSAVWLGTRSQAGRILLATIGCLMIAAVSMGRGLPMGMVWISVLAILLAVGRAARHRGRNVAAGALVLVVIYLGGALLVREHIAREARASTPALAADNVVKIDVLPGRPTSDHSWLVVAEAPERFYVAEVGLQDWQKNPPAFEEYDKNLTHPCYLAALSQRQMAVMARFARYPSVSVETSDGTCSVWLRDLRYARKNRPGWGAAHATVPLPQH